VDDKDMQQAMVDRILEEDGGESPFFRMLTDVDHAVIDRYGLFNPDESRGRPVPHPAVLVVDQSGVVRWKFIEINYRVRPTNEDIVEGLMEARSHRMMEGGM
jgi:alkyl hydroperoxide reductase subunit AhpC